jgi:2-methylcitrate dehydratase PrpD
LLAYGEWKKVNGRKFLLSLILGIEAETRISIAMGASHYDRGWHSTATMGRFGAAAGVGRMAGLIPGNMACAMGIAGTQSSGIRMVFGTMTKSFHPGKAAADGLLAVLLAKKGYTAPANIMEGEKGLGALLSSDFNYDRGFNGLGQDFNILGISFKPYASCLYTHPLIHGIIQLRREHQIKPQDVKKIECHISRFCYDAACKRHPQTGLEAKFSSYYCAAIALLEGKAGNDLFRDDCVTTGKILQYMEKVVIFLSPLLTDSEAEVLIYLNNGHCCQCHVEHPLGDPWNPLDDLSLAEKARHLLSSRFSKKRIAEIIDMIWDFDSVRNLEVFSNLFKK